MAALYLSFDLSFIYLGALPVYYMYFMGCSCVCINFFGRGRMLFSLLCLILHVVGDKGGKELLSFRGQLCCLQFPSICYGVKHEGIEGGYGPV